MGSTAKPHGSVADERSERDICEALEQQRPVVVRVRVGPRDAGHESPRRASLTRADRESQSVGRQPNQGRRGSPGGDLVGVGDLPQTQVQPIHFRESGAPRHAGITVRLFWGLNKYLRQLRHF